MLRPDWDAIVEFKKNGPPSAEYILLAIVRGCETIVAGLRIGFPHLFYEDNGAGPKMVALSTLREIAALLSLIEYDDMSEHYARAFDLPKLDLPTVLEWGLDGTGSTPCPIDGKELVGQIARPCISVEFEGLSCLILNVHFSTNEPEAGRRIEKPPGFIHVILVESKYVDLRQ